VPPEAKYTFAAKFQDMKARSTNVWVVSVHLKAVGASTWSMGTGGPHMDEVNNWFSHVVEAADEDPGAPMILMGGDFNDSHHHALMEQAAAAYAAGRSTGIVDSILQGEDAAAAPTEGERRLLDLCARRRGDGELVSTMRPKNVHETDVKHSLLRMGGAVLSAGGSMLGYADAMYDLPLDGLYSFSKEELRKVSGSAHDMSRFSDHDLVIAKVARVEDEDEDEDEGWEVVGYQL
jgi:hypothetical protein